MSDLQNKPASDGDAVREVIEALLREGTNQQQLQNRPSKEAIQRALEAISTNASVATEFFNAAFPAGITADPTFYDRLARCEYKLGHHAGVHTFVGRLWRHAFSELEAPKNLDLLKALPQHNGHSFFVGLHALPEFLEKVQLPADFLCSWLSDIRTRLGNNLASAPFWNGLQSLARAFPEAALAVTKLFSGNFVDENTITIAANLLGHLRATQSLPDLPKVVAQLRDHQHADRRLIYHRSWITLGVREPVAANDFAEAIEHMSMGTKEEIDEAFNVIRVLLPLPHLSDESFLFGLQWLRERTDAKRNDFWKHFVIQLARELHERWELVGKPAGLAPCTDLVLAILPIRDDHKGTWNELEELFAFLLDHNRTQFRDFLRDVAARDPEGLANRFRSREEFSEITTKLTAANGSEFVVDAFLSDADSIRHVGFAIFEALGLANLEDQRLFSASDNRIALLICSFQLEPFYDEVIRRFLLAIEPRIRGGSQQLQDFFVGELVYQCKNLPGACLAALKNQTGESPLIRRAVEEAEKYFDALRPCFQSAINSIGIPSLKRAARVKAARQSREMRAQIDKASIFAEFCSTSYTLYGGTKWRTFMGGKLGEISEMQQISRSAEVPRMPGIDPEGMAIRRHHATVMISRLLAIENRGMQSDT